MESDWTVLISWVFEIQLSSEDLKLNKINVIKGVNGSP